MKQRTARVGKNNRAQVVTIPLEFRFPEGMKEVFIRKVGDDSRAVTQAGRLEPLPGFRREGQRRLHRQSRRPAAAGA